MWLSPCWKDEALKARFMSDPKAVLAEHGIDVPDNMNVNVVQNSDNSVHITMPMAPDGATELSDKELTGAAGRYALDDCRNRTPHINALSMHRPC